MEIFNGGSTGSVSLTFPITDTEATRSPYWLILEPTKMVEPDIDHLASMITGPFFSREDAKVHLAVSNSFSKRAVVYCHSGHSSRLYDRAWDYAWKRKTKERVV